MISNPFSLSNWMSYPILEKTGDDVTDPTDGKLIYFYGNFLTLTFLVSPKIEKIN